MKEQFFNRTIQYFIEVAIIVLCKWTLKYKYSSTLLLYWIYKSFKYLEITQNTLINAYNDCNISVELKINKFPKMMNQQMHSTNLKPEIWPNNAKKKKKRTILQIALALFCFKRKAVSDSVIITIPWVKRTPIIFILKIIFT
jgi:hypothetical protein